MILFFRVKIFSTLKPCKNKRRLQDQSLPPRREKTKNHLSTTYHERSEATPTEKKNQETHLSPVAGVAERAKRRQRRRRRRLVVIAAEGRRPPRCLRLVFFFFLPRRERINPIHATELSTDCCTNARRRRKRRGNPRTRGAPEGGDESGGGKGMARSSSPESRDQSEATNGGRGGGKKKPAPLAIGSLTAEASRHARPRFLFFSFLFFPFL